MPVPNLASRVVCGQFYWQFQNFMRARAERAKAARTRTVKACWPLSFVRTVFVCAVILVMCSSSDSHTGSGQSDNPGVHRQKNDTTSPIQHSVAALHSSMQMLAIATRPLKTAHAAQGKQSRYVTVQQSRRRLTGIVAACVSVLLVGYLLTCGDVESNPGPGTGQEAGYNGRAQGKEAKRGVHTHPAQPSRFSQQPLDSFHAEISHILNQAVARMESTTRQQGHSIERRLQSVEEKIDHRLREVEVNQAQLSSSVDGLRSQCQALWSENQDLRDTVNYLTNKCDYNDNQSRRNNLLFLGFEPVRGGPESWQDCERKVKEVIHEGMGIAEEVHIERAHRAGKAIVARFLSYKQKMAVLSKARELKNSDYDHIYVREDFSESVQTKRQALMKLQRELRQRGVKANLSFDKLIAGDSVYTYDMASNRTVRKARRSRQATWRRDDQFHETGRRWDAQGDRDGHHGTTNDLWPTATPEHRPRSSPASSNYLLPTYLPPMSEFPPLQSGRDEIMDTSVDNEDVAEIRPLWNPNTSAINANIAIDSTVNGSTTTDSSSIATNDNPTTGSTAYCNTTIGITANGTTTKVSNTNDSIASSNTANDNSANDVSVNDSIAKGTGNDNTTKGSIATGNTMDGNIASGGSTTSSNANSRSHTNNTASGNTTNGTTTKVTNTNDGSVDSSIPSNIKATEQPQGTANVYNLRTRGSVSTVAEAGCSDMSNSRDTRSNSESTARANLINSTPGVQKARDFSRGHGKHSPSQGRIDTMFRRSSTQLAQTDNASEAVRAEVDDSGECFDDVTDTT